MSTVIHLPENFISKDDRVRLESFGGHTIGHGRATRWQWVQDVDGDDAFRIFRGGAAERLAAVIRRNREHDAFHADDGEKLIIATGALDHVLGAVDAYFMTLHGEVPDEPA